MALIARRRSIKKVRPAKVEIAARQTLRPAPYGLESVQLRHERFDGSMTDALTRVVFDAGDSAAVLLVDPDEDVVFLVEQFRLPAHLRNGSGWLMEIPAGRIRDGETAEDCLRREVIEETGYQITNMQEIARFFPSPGATAERMFLYYAEVRAREESGGGVADDGEDIFVENLRVEDFCNRLTRGDFLDAKTIIAAQWLMARRARYPAEHSPDVTRTFAFRIPGSQRIVGYKTGSMLAVKDVDVWVNPTDTDMQLDPFSFSGKTVSAAIRMYGAERHEDSDRIKEDTIGKALRAQLRERGFVEPATVVDTVPGALAKRNNVKRLFHVAVAAGQIGERILIRPETLDTCVDRVLALVERNNGSRWTGPVYTSVLFPILGTGQGGLFNRDVVPRLVRRAIHFLKENPEAGLTRIFFSGYTVSDKELLERELAAAVAAGVLERVEAAASGEVSA